MRWSYDTGADALYVTLRDGSPVSQEELEDGTIVDLDKAGEVLGVEVLGFGRGWTGAAITSRFPDDSEVAKLVAVHFHLPRAHSEDSEPMMGSVSEATIGSSAALVTIG